MSLCKNKYRIEPARLDGWDYSSNGAYFITVCTHDRLPFFGQVVNDAMVLNQLGSIVESEWIHSVELRPDMNLSTDEFIVMPNHFHAILFIGDNQYNTGLAGSTVYFGNLVFGPQRKNLSSIVGGFKSAVTRKARELLVDFKWQPRFHDHIIRNQDSYLHIRNYIISNPANWKKDKFYRE